MIRLFFPSRAAFFRKKGLAIHGTSMYCDSFSHTYLLILIIWSILRLRKPLFSYNPSIESIADRFLSQEIVKADKFQGNADIVARGFDVARRALTGPPGETSNKGDKSDGGDTIVQDKVLESGHEGETSSDAEGSDIAGGSQGSDS